MKMFENISQCVKCDLYKNQKPLLDNVSNADIMWVGLSAKKVSSLFDSIPLDNNTATGKIIEEIETKEFLFYKTNLVKCVPLDQNQKLRYPTTKEMQSCLDNLIFEILTIKPKLVFLLGTKVSDLVLKQLKSKRIIDKFNNETIVILEKIQFQKIYHPSYIAVYKRKEKHTYVQDVKDIIKNYVK